VVWQAIRETRTTLMRCWVPDIRRKHGTVTEVQTARNRRADRASDVTAGIRRVEIVPRAFIPG